MDSIEEPLEFEEKLQDTEFKKKMVIWLFVFVLTAHCIYNIWNILPIEYTISKASCLIVIKLAITESI